MKFMSNSMCILKKFHLFTILLITFCIDCSLCFLCRFSHIWYNQSQICLLLLWHWYFIVFVLFSVSRFETEWSVSTITWVFRTAIFRKIGRYFVKREKGKLKVMKIRSSDYSIKRIKVLSGSQESSNGFFTV